MVFVDLDELRPDIKTFIAGQLKPGEKLLTNASTGVEIVKDQRARRLKRKRLKFGETSAEEFAARFSRAPEYKSVRLVKYPSNILPGSSAVIVQPR